MNQAHNFPFYFFKIIVSQGLGLLSCCCSEFISETYVSIGQLVGLLGRGIRPTQGLYLHTEQHNTEKRRHTSMPRVGFETKTPVFERPNEVPASDSSAIGTGISLRPILIISSSHLRLGLPNGLYSSSFPVKKLMTQALDCSYSVSTSLH
jgi:hypothetical protein